MSQIKQSPLSIDKEDLNKLHESFTLLKSTTEKVSHEALTTATYLRKQLSQTVYRFFNVIDAVNDFILIKDRAGRWKTLNKFAQDLYGFSKITDFYEKTDEEIANEFPHHKIGLLNCIETDNQAWQSKSYFRATESFEINNQLRYFDVVKTPVFDEDGNRKELIIIGRDITNLKNAELRNKACMIALNSASDLLIIIDKLGFITFANEAFVKVFDFEDFVDVINHSLFDILSENCKDYITCDSAILHTIDTHHIWTENVIITKNETQLTYSIIIIPVMNGGPKPTYYICKMRLLN